MSSIALEAMPILEQLEAYLRYIVQDETAERRTCGTCNPLVIEHVRKKTEALRQKKNSQNSSRLRKNSSSYGNLADLTETDSFCNFGPTPSADSETKKEI